MKYTTLKYLLACLLIVSTINTMQVNNPIIKELFDKQYTLLAQAAYFLYHDKNLPHPIKSLEYKYEPDNNSIIVKLILEDNSLHTFTNPDLPNDLIQDFATNFDQLSQHMQSEPHI